MFGMTTSLAIHVSVVRVVQKMAGIKYPLIPEDAEEMGF